MAIAAGSPSPESPLQASDRDQSDARSVGPSDDFMCCPFANTRKILAPDADGHHGEATFVGVGPTSGARRAMSGRLDSAEPQRRLQRREQASADAHTLPVVELELGDTTG